MEDLIIEVFQFTNAQLWKLLIFFIVLLILMILRRRLTPQEIVSKDELIDSIRSLKTPSTAKDAPPTLDLETVDVPTVKATPPEAVQVDLAPVSEPASFMQRLQSGLSKTRNSLSQGLDQIFSQKGRLDEELIEELEELLITSDIGVNTSMALIEEISKKASEFTTADDLKTTLKQLIIASIPASQAPLVTFAQKPHIILVVGVNGVGKTTTIGKLATKFASQGKKILIAAADTFRAAASEQLTIWAERANADIVKHRDNADPASVAFDSVERAMARNVDIVLIDTAGRLHTKVNLMEELKKIKRAVQKKIETAPHETLMVVDATTGQNALTQAKLFNDAIGITGIVLTKLDGTAKGGIVVNIASTLNVPIHFIGVGESADDLQNFDPKEFAEALI